MDYPYQVVQGPQSASYSGPTVNWSAPLQALAGVQRGQQGQQGQQQGQQGQSGQLTAQYGQMLSRLLNGGQGGQPGQPMNIQPQNAGVGTVGSAGTNPVLFGSPIY